MVQLWNADVFCSPFLFTSTLTNTQSITKKIQLTHLLVGRFFALKQVIHMFARLSTSRVDLIIAEMPVPTLVGQASEHESWKPSSLLAQC